MQLARLASGHAGAHCTCMAGLSETCSLEDAVLHWVETAVRVQNYTPCTSKENKWLTPTPVMDITYLELCGIDFTTPKRQSTVLVCTTNTSANTLIAESRFIPIPFWKAGIFLQICIILSRRIILSVIQPYSNNFVLSSDHLPKLLQGLDQPAYLESDYTELLKLAEKHLHDEVIPAMVDHLAQLTCKQSN